MRIANAEKKDWKRELKTYLTAYRSLPHPTAGMSPAELLFGRKIRTKLPELKDVHVEQECHDRDSEQKARYKAYADARRGAKYSNTNIGDEVLVKQGKQNKLTTTFSPVPYRVVDKKGNSLQIESPDGVQYSRNTSHVKKYITESATTEEVIPEKPYPESYPATLSTPIRLQLRSNVDQDHKGQGSL